MLSREVLSAAFPFQLALVDAGAAEGMQAALAALSAEAREEFLGKNEVHPRDVSFPRRRHVPMQKGLLRRRSLREESASVNESLKRSF